MIGTAIRKLLIDNPDFTAIAGTRVYPVRVAQGVLFPAVSYQKISNTPTQCKEGDANLDRIRLQINIYAERYEQQEVLAKIIRTTLGGFKGSVLATNIADITYESETDLHDDAAETYFLEQDYIITIKK